MAKAKKQKLSIEEKLEQALVPEDEQPYGLPNNWVWTKLDTVATWGSGGTPSRRISEYYNGSIPWVKTGELDNGLIYDTKEKISEEALKNSSAKLFPKNTIVIAMYGATIGKVAILGIEATTNQACACGVSSLALYYKYLFYYAMSQKDNFIKMGKGGAQPNISQEIIKAHYIPLPPSAEQKRIVDRIESLFEKLENAKELAQNALDTFETRKASILNKAFTGELTAKWREENGVEMDSWKDAVLKNHISILGDGLHGTPKYSDDGSYYFINGNNLGGVSIVFKEDTKRVNDAEYEKYKKHLTNDTVFISINGTLGKTAFYNNEPIILGKSACYFNVKDTLYKYFIRYYIETKVFIDYAHKMATGSTIKNLSLKAMRNLPLRLPLISEQQEIVRILDNLSEKEEHAKELCDVIDKIDLMKKAILARAFRGELDTNDPNEESSIELLKEILAKE